MALADLFKIEIRHPAHWACIGGLGGGDDPLLKEFDYNHETEKQVLM